MALHRAWRRARAAVAVCTTLVLVTAGCAGGGGSAAEPLVVYTGQSGDYQRNFNPYSPTLIEGPGTIFEPLFFYNAAGDDEADPVPRLGTDFSWNEDGTELTITTREGVKWSDGEEFTAEDVVFTLDLVAEHAGLNQIGYEGEATLVDDTHLVVTFPEPSYMVEAQVLGEIWVLPEHVWSDIEDPATDVMPEPVGTGPYTLGEFKPQAFTLTANPDYWGGQPAVRTVRYVALSGNQAGADALAAGNIDWNTGPVPDIHDVEENYPGYRSITVPMNQIALFTCSNAELGCEGAQTDPAVRRAVYHAMDREQINKLAFQNTASAISPGFALPERDREYVSAELADRTAPMRPDTDRAVELLEEAGYTRGEDGVYAKDGERLSFTVKVPSGWTDYVTAVDTLTEQLDRVGIELTAQQLSWNEWSDARGRGEYEMLIDSLYQGPAPDPYYLYNFFFHSDHTAPVGETANPNFARFSDPDVDKALETLRRTNPDDTEARQAAYDRVQTEVEAAMPYIPVLTGGTTSEFNAERFTGWPARDDLYAFPAVWDRPDHSQIYLNLKPAGA